MSKLHTHVQTNEYIFFFNTYVNWQFYERIPIYITMIQASPNKKQIDVVVLTHITCQHYLLLVYIKCTTQSVMKAYFIIFK